MKVFIILFLNLLLQCHAENGIITFYSNLNNACQYDENLYNNFLKVAISGEHWDNSLACGTCLTITGKGSGIGTTPFTNYYNAIVTNLCSECESHHYDLLMDGNGIWDMEYQIIPCQHDNQIQYRTISDNPFYFKIQIINTAVPVHSLIVNGDDCQKTFDNFWVFNKLIRYPVNIQFALQDGTTFFKENILPSDNFSNFLY